MSGFGYSGSAYDQWVSNQDSRMLADSTLDKVQHQFWVTKQTVLRKFGKKEDECITASDSELDAKLDLFRSIQETCHSLDNTIERYQERLLVLAQEEAAMGRFLKEQGKNDKTRAGKMLVAVGKVMSYSAQQRMALRTPLARLYQEVDTFCQRAIQDSGQTIHEMEKCRNEYRGALLWMKNVSQELDPDTYKQLEKFRKVQGQVKESKARFDRRKLACLQKVDLLAAARCNMFSHGLIPYQKNLMQYWEKNSKAMNAVSDSFKGYQYYEFSVIKELAEPSKKLADKATAAQPSEDAEGYFFFESEFRDDGVLEKTDSSKDKEKVKAKDKCARSDTTQPKREDAKSETATSACLELLQELGLVDLGSPVKTSQDLMTPFEMPNNMPVAQVPSDSQALLLENSSDLAELDVFGAFQSSPLAVSGDLMQSEGNLLDDPTPATESSATFAFSQLLDWNAMESAPMPTAPQINSTKRKENQPAATKKAHSGKDMASWYNLFADLDPLANPDAVGSKDTNDRNC